MKASLEIINSTKERLLAWAQQHNTFVLLDGNSYPLMQEDGDWGDFSMLLAADPELELKCSSDPFKELEKFSKGQHVFGFLSYDLKNYLEDLKTSHENLIDFPEIHFFVPKYIIVVTRQGSIEVLKSPHRKEETINAINSARHHNVDNPPLCVKSKQSVEDYLATVKKIKEHIHRGDIYEMNYCQEFFVENASLDPISAYLDLMRLSPTPFASLYKMGHRYLLSASPERFLKKMGRKIISQPIKGTIRRGDNEAEDAMLREQLRANPKERSENIMIVDLVRNDLSKTALDGSVQVSELCGIYPFRQVYQMISTVESTVDEHYTAIDVIKKAFPMGSMTGAPKVRAMQLIDQYEQSQRGLYSGAVGYITANGDFDFNVVIRSILYNSQSKYLSFTAGGAITSGSDPMLEYEECLIKAKAIKDLLERR